MADKDRPALSVTAAQVRALRAKAHRLDQRVIGEDALSEVAGVCGLQDSPPGAATTAFHARVVDLTPSVLERALAVDRTLVRTWAMRGAPYVVPTAELSVFTTGVLPVDEEARKNLIQGVRQALDVLTGDLDDIVAATADAYPGSWPGGCWTSTNWVVRWRNESGSPCQSAIGPSGTPRDHIRRGSHSGRPWSTSASES